MFHILLSFHQHRQRNAPFFRMRSALFCRSQPFQVFDWNFEEEGVKTTKPKKTEWIQATSSVRFAHTRPMDSTSGLRRVARAR